MCVSIEVYRFRIGRFLPKIKTRVQNQVSSRYLIKNSYLQMVFSVLIVYIMFNLVSLNNDRVPLTGRLQQMDTCLCNVVRPIENTQATFYIALSNFFA